jgi:Skp family chaperone for outer membrane proteins
MKRILVLVTLVALMMVMTASPAFAFIHAFVPVEQCAASEQAGENETAARNIPRNPIATPPAADTPAVDECAAP